MAGSPSRPRGPGVFGTILLRGSMSRTPESTEGGEVRGPQKRLNLTWLSSFWAIAKGDGKPEERQRKLPQGRGRDDKWAMSACLQPYAQTFYPLDLGCR